MRFGRQPHDPVRHAKLPTLARYRTASAEPVETVDWLTRVPPDGWGMYANDTLGDCTCAAVAHLLMLWESFNPPVQAPSDADVVRLYQDFGYNPTDPATDNGAFCIDVLDWWKQRGVPVLGTTNELLAFCTVDHTNVEEVQEAIRLFGGLYVGIRLSNAQVNDPTWDVSPDANEGHCIAVGAFSPYSLTGITWGRTQPMTWAFWGAQVDEVYAPLSLRWLNSKLADPSGINLDQLITDLNNL